MEQYNIEVKANTSSFAGLVSNNVKKVNLYNYIKKVFDYLRTTPGTVLKDTMVGVDDLTILSDTIATSITPEIFLTYDYTPVSNNSYLIVDFYLSKYECQGNLDDSWVTRMLIDGDEIGWAYQAATEISSFRTGTLFPLKGRFTNSSTVTKQIQLDAKRDSSDDDVKINTGLNSMYLRITEVAR